MKLCLKHKKGLVKKYQLDILKDFILLLQKEKPLEGNLTIEFLEKRTKDMTTGQFSKNKSRIRVLFRDRMLADVLRTLSHEWIHEYQKQISKIKGKNKIEDEANMIAGRLLKSFEKQNPNLEKKIYNRD